jgi:hypothetical protein
MELGKILLEPLSQEKFIKAVISSNKQLGDTYALKELLWRRIRQYIKDESYYFLMWPLKAHAIESLKEE